MERRPADQLWDSVDALLARTHDPDRLRAHGLSVLAARRLRRLGAPVDPGLVADERASGAMSLLVRPLLARIRAAVRGEVVLFKGPEVARLYDGQARIFGDLDILVGDAAGAQRALLAAGFAEIPDPDRIYVGLHHRRPLAWPGLPLKIEVHHAVKWPAGLTPPDLDRLFETRVPSTLADGVETLAPEQHALVLAAHAWAHRPLRSVRDLLDVAVVSQAADAWALERVAREWGIERLWRSTRRAVDALFFGASRPLSMRLWGRHLVDVRERVVVENHLEALVSAAWGLPAGAALRTGVQALRGDIVPASEESWRDKLARTATALTHAFMTISQHDRTLGPAAYRGQGRNAPGPEDA